MIADEVTEALGVAGVEVVGPAASVGTALDLSRGAGTLDGAILDVSLGREMIWPVVELLAEGGVPTVPVTGYDAGTVPPAYAHLLRCEKPMTTRDLLRALAKRIEVEEVGRDGVHLRAVPALSQKST
ncbi:response regulator [Muricoccus aerilatus]|uniref:response regulator n=1 Tax=Muricoccus aerilatus TaxID=452982 RepID=UPI000AA8C140|nr:response regulator [Roseomonas aerilata]